MRGGPVQPDLEADVLAVVQGVIWAEAQPGMRVDGQAQVALGDVGAAPPVGDADLAVWALRKLRRKAPVRAGRRSVHHALFRSGDRNARGYADPRAGDRRATP